MIKVLNRDIKTQQFYRQVCCACGAELEFSFDDTYEGAYGSRYLKCPVCDDELIAAEIDDIALTSENIKFPIHFYHTGEDAVDIEDEKIQQWVRDGLKAFQDGKAKDFWFSGMGNAFMIMLEMEDEYDIYVMKNYWEFSINKKDVFTKTT